MAILYQNKEWYYSTQQEKKNHQIGHHQKRQREEKTRKQGGLVTKSIALILVQNGHYQPCSNTKNQSEGMVFSTKVMDTVKVCCWTEANRWTGFC